MCKFFSCVSDPSSGKIMYFDAEIRKKIIAGELIYETDSHTSIADYFGYKGKDEDKLNKYEYNPLTKRFTVDQINSDIDDSEKVKKFCENLDFKTIVPELIIKPIINPFELPQNEVTEQDIEDLKKWIEVRTLVIGSVGNSVWDSVRYSVRYSVGNSVWDSVRYSVRYSAGNSVRYSVENSVWAYYSSFFNIKYDHDFSPAIRLWERGFVPSFNGKVWRLHSGKKAEVVYTLEV